MSTRLGPALTSLTGSDRRVATELSCGAAAGQTVVRFIDLWSKHSHSNKHDRHGNANGSTGTDTVVSGTLGGEWRHGRCGVYRSRRRYTSWSGGGGGWHGLAFHRLHCALTFVVLGGLKPILAPKNQRWRLVANWTIWNLYLAVSS